MLSTSTRVALIALLGFTAVRSVSAEPAAAATSPYASTATGTMKSIGCYSSSGDFTNAGSYEWQTSSHCQATCLALQKPVLGLNQGGDCWCGDLLPAPDTQVSTSQCNIQCFGYSEPCKSSDTERRLRRDSPTDASFQAVAPALGLYGSRATPQ